MCCSNQSKQLNMSATWKLRKEGIKKHLMQQKKFSSNFQMESSQRKSKEKFNVLLQKNKLEKF